MDGVFDAETLAWIEKTERESAPPRASVADIRAAYSAMRMQQHKGRPNGMVVDDLTLASRPARRYYGGSRGRVLFFHGGGYVVGSLDTHDDLCAAIAAQTKAEIFSLDYRLAPEHPFPAACDDALAAAVALKGPLVLAGDSAGGTLAAGVAVALRGSGKIAGHVLAYPALGGRAMGLKSYTEKADAPLLTTSDMDWYNAQWGAPVGDPKAAPLLTEDLKGIAPCAVFAAGEDPLRDDAMAWAERLRAVEVDVQVTVEKGLPHSYLFARHDSAWAASAFERIVAAIRGFATAS